MIYPKRIFIVAILGSIGLTAGCAGMSPTVNPAQSVSKFPPLSSELPRDRRRLNILASHSLLQSRLVSPRLRSMLMAQPAGAYRISRLVVMADALMQSFR